MSNKTGSKKHTHRYHNIAGQWHCSLADCTHFMPKNVEGNILGKKSICWSCASEFILDEISLAMDKPLCMGCTNREQTETVDDFLKSKGL